MLPSLSPASWLVLLFVVFGWGKLANYSATVGYMANVGTPIPFVAALVAIVVEFFVALAVAFGAWTRPLALLLALYTLGTALIAHHFWTMDGAAALRTRSTSTKTSALLVGSSCSMSLVAASIRWMLASADSRDFG